MRRLKSWTLALAALAVLPLPFIRPGQTTTHAATPAPTPQSARVSAVTEFFSHHCVTCHGPKQQKGDLVLHTLVDPASLNAGRKAIQNALKMVRSGEMPPDDKPQPTPAEVDTFATAVSAFYTEVDRTSPPDPGRVTVRRLNRTEYNNTIRDLLGVDFRPADDFPSDDIGHGFDNIGDVLTISPLLMERYLAAAENVSQTAIVVEPTKPPNRYQQAQFLEPAGPGVPTTKYRPVPKGQVNTPFKLGEDGEYRFRTRVYAHQVGTEKVRVAILQNGQQIHTEEITASDGRSAQQIELTLKLAPGDYRFAVALLNPSPEAKDLDISGRSNPKNPIDRRPTTAPAASQPDVRTLYIDHIELGGPADTRPASHRKLLAAADPKAPRAEQTRQILSAFASRAYRRPASKDEVDRLTAMADQCTAAGQKWEEGLQLALQAVLVSPKFLFRLELDDRPGSPEACPLDEYALASRLSYFLWSTMPDQELFDLAGEQQLTANLEQQARRMLADPKAKSLVDNFALQWLQLKRLKAFQPDAKQFPTFDEPLRSAMQRETELFLDAIIREDHSILDLIDADFTFLNDRLARHYGIADTNGNWLNQKPDRPVGTRIPYNRFVRVTLPKDGPRGGLLTQASILAVTSNPTRTSPVKRGKWVLEQILGAPPPPPPPNVPELVEGDKAVATGSLRKRMEAHRENPLCANCHAKMDPIGFAFENFDAIGAFRPKDGGFDIDPSGQLPDGSKFQGPKQLRNILLEKRKDAVVRCLAEKLLTYALGRGLEYYDDRAVTAITRASEPENYKFSKLVVEIVKSDPFRMRRGLSNE